MPEYIGVIIHEALRREMGPRAIHITKDLGAEALGRFAAATIHYGDDFQDGTGLKGQWCDIARKVGPLKRALWEGAELTRESPREICLDLIGHLLMTIDMLDRLEAANAAAEEAASNAPNLAAPKIADGTPYLEAVQQAMTDAGIDIMPPAFEAYRDALRHVAVIPPALASAINKAAQDFNIDLGGHGD